MEMSKLMDSRPSRVICNYIISVRWAHKRTDRISIVL